MPSFGEEIRRERELRQISLREIADATKISVRHLQALEGNTFDRLPGGVFNRGFVRAYSEYIGIDPEAMVNAYLLEEQTQQSRGTDHDPGVLRRRVEPARAPEESRAAPRSARSLLKWGLMLILLAAILAGLVYLALRFAGRGDDRSSAGPRASIAELAFRSSTAPSVPTEWPHA